MNVTLQKTRVLEDEPALIIRAATEPAAFGAIFDHYYPLIHKYILYRANDEQTTDDLTSLVFEHLLTDLHRFKSNKAPFGAWLFGIARHIVVDHFRSQKRNRWLLIEHLPHLTAVDLPPEDTTMQNESNQQLLSAIKKLSDREKDLIGLKFAGGFNNRQIAKLTGLRESNVGVILYRSIQKLRVKLIKEVFTND